MYASPGLNELIKKDPIDNWNEKIQAMGTRLWTVQNILQKSFRVELKDC